MDLRQRYDGSELGTSGADASDDESGSFWSDWANAWRVAGETQTVNTPAHQNETILNNITPVTNKVRTS